MDSNGCNPLKLHCDPWGFQEPSLHPKPDPLNLEVWLIVRASTTPFLNTRRPQWQIDNFGTHFVCRLTCSVQLILCRSKQGFGFVVVLLLWDMLLKKLFQLALSIYQQHQGSCMCPRWKGRWTGTSYWASNQPQRLHQGGKKSNYNAYKILIHCSPYFNLCVCVCVVCVCVCVCVCLNKWRELQQNKKQNWVNWKVSTIDVFKQLAGYRCQWT